MYNLLDVVKHQDFKFSSRKNYVAFLITDIINQTNEGINVATYKNCPITNAANTLCNKFKAKKVNKEKFIKLEQDWLASYQIRVSNLTRDVPTSTLDDLDSDNF